MDFHVYLQETFNWGRHKEEDKRSWDKVTPSREGPAVVAATTGWPPKNSQWHHMIICSIFLSFTRWNALDWGRGIRSWTVQSGSSRSAGPIQGFCFLFFYFYFFILFSFYFFSITFSHFYNVVYLHPFFCIKLHVCVILFLFVIFSLHILVNVLILFLALKG